MLMEEGISEIQSKKKKKSHSHKNADSGPIPAAGRRSMGNPIETKKLRRNQKKSLKETPKCQRKSSLASLLQPVEAHTNGVSD